MMMDFRGIPGKETPTLSSGELDGALRKAVWSPLDSTQLAGTARIVLLPEEIQFRQEGGRMPPVDSTRTWTSHFVQERKRGERVTDLKRHFKIDVTPERFQVLTQSGIVFSEDLPIEPDTVAVSQPLAQ